uniref:Uncharacterized protein n=1 Tax=Diadromus pulchellus ascovirus 4a TaxID=158683 RepID=Q9DSX5_9VIRU|nr:hypothetical protein [Diadromus pulchellus ascovirus 4a]
MRNLMMLCTSLAFGVCKELTFFSVNRLINKFLPRLGLKRRTLRLFRRETEAGAEELRSMRSPPSLQNRASFR